MCANLFRYLNTSKGKCIYTHAEYYKAVALIEVGDSQKMSNDAPTMIGDRFSIISYVDPATFKKIEELRGDVSRSRYVGKLIQKSIA